MRPRVEWMNQTDDRILEALDESGMVLTPVVLAKNLDYSRTWVSTRVSKLVDAGLVENPEGSFYQITEKGSKYLAGDLAADELENKE
jgi:predicted transcriptional regulator